MKTNNSRIYRIVIIGLLLTFTFSCDKEDPVELPKINTSSVTDITTNTAKSGGNITGDGGASVTSRGVVWSTSENPTVENHIGKTTDGQGSGEFTSILSELSPGAKYYVRAYAVNSAGTAYGSQVQFTTIELALATVTTAEITDITSNSAKSGGNVTDDGGAEVTDRGVCWNTLPNPTTSNDKTSDGSGTGSFTSSITGLQPGTTYYIRAYATNSIGTAYGNDELNFSTGCVAPSATTDPASPVGTTTATLRGTVNANGSSTTVTFEYGTTTSYGSTVTATPETVTESSNTSVSADINGLTPGQTYHYRVKAVNCGGTAHGNDLTFLTSTTVPGTPKIGTATAGNAQATVTFTPPDSDGGSPITEYTVTSSPHEITGTGTSSPITVTGLTNLTSYTFTVVAININGNSAPSAASNSVIPGTVTNPATGKIWMDRNLGATQVATIPTDAKSYGHLYQWGRGSDGHQLRTSLVTKYLVNKDSPGHDRFIYAPEIPHDWRSPGNSSLWQGVNGINNPCPDGYRLPTEAELDAERQSWSSNDAAGAIASPLKLPMAGNRTFDAGWLRYVGERGNYWSSTAGGTNSRYLAFSITNAVMGTNFRAYGFSVRCIKD